MNLEDITDLDRDRIVSAGIELMAAITEVFGPDQGYKIWDDLSTQFGDGIKHAIFLSMLTGNASGFVTISGGLNLRGHGNFIEVIKCIRSHAGIGLKEAKDICDEVNTGTSKRVNVAFDKRGAFIDDLRELGVRAS
jgi:hypothetical protein